MTNDMVRQKHSSGEENCSHLKSLEDDIDEVVDKDTVIDIKMTWSLLRTTLASVGNAEGQQAGALVPETMINRSGSYCTAERRSSARKDFAEPRIIRQN
ncbi:unnamed protein product [Rhizophagus irregularis]|nr:unnamed protein product [Rhizophagus irregularis]